MMQAVIDTVTHGAGRDSTPRPHPETASHRRARVLRPTRHLNGPTEAINGRLEHLGGSALGFRNLTNYIARNLLESGRFSPHLHPSIAMSP